MKYVVSWQDRTWEVEVTGSLPEYCVRIDGKEYPVDVHTLGDPSMLSVLLNHTSFLTHVIPAASSRGHWEVSIGGKFARIEVLDELSSMAKHMRAEQNGGSYVLLAPMPGLIVDIKVQTGDHVEVGTPLIVMEAMKMQNELTSETAGIVQEIHASKQDAVESGAKLLEIVAD